MKKVTLNANQSILMQTLVAKENFYAEAGFSDISKKDIFKMVSDKMDETTAKRTLTSLIRKRLFHTDTFEDYQINGKGKAAKVKYTIVYLSDSLYHMIEGWEDQAVDPVELVYTENAEAEVKPTGPRGPLADLTGKEFNVNDEAQKELAYFEALQKTDAKNAKTAMHKFIKSNRVKARYYGVTLVRK